jgi:HSP20 family protein
MSKEKSPKPGKPGFQVSLEGLFGNLGSLVERLGELAEKGGELRREGTLEPTRGGKGLKGVYGFTVKVGLGRDKVEVEPFGNIKKDEKGEPTVADEREPIVDVFDETDHVLVVAELPGAEESAVKTEVKDDVLLISAIGKDRKYQKEVLLPCKFPAAALSRCFRNGILEVKLAKRK